MDLAAFFLIFAIVAASFFVLGRIYAETHQPPNDAARQIANALRLLRAAETNCDTIETLVERSELAYIFVGIVKTQIQQALNSLVE